MDTRLVIVVLASFLAVGFSDDDHGSNAVSFTKASFNTVVNEKPLFVMFFAPWCGHCKRLVPIWDDLAKETNNGGQVTVGMVDCTVQTELCSDHGVRGYPTVKLFNKNTEGDKFSGARTLENLKDFIETKLNEGEKPKEAEKQATGTGKAVIENGVYALTGETFADHVAKGHHFVKFYAPWCGHCKKLVPTWEDMAGSLKDSGIATVAKIDCTQHSDVCSKYSVRGFPTLLWFTDGQQSDEYNGMRDITSLIKFVNKMSSPENQNKKNSQDGMVPDGKPAAGGEPAKEDAMFVLTDATYEGHLSTGNHFVKFYAPWCGHCKNLAPTWLDLAKDLEGGSDVKIGKLDCTTNRDACAQYEVSGYPTLLFISEGENKGRYRGPRDLKSLKDYVNEMNAQTDVKPKEEKEEEEVVKEELEIDSPKLGVVELTDEDFEETIGEDLTLVMFADDKCKDCKAISKVLEEVADSFDEPEIMIAVINCEKSKTTCNKQNVKDDYPKLRLYNNGKFVGLYTGEKTLAAMKGYVGLQLKTLGGHGGEL